MASEHSRTSPDADRPHKPRILITDSMTTADERSDLGSTATRMRSLVRAVTIEVQGKDVREFAARCAPIGPDTSIGIEAFRHHARHGREEPCIRPSI